jgi:uncharacterized membrane-anchored protein YitT (DUF2179 family)
VRILTDLTLVARIINRLISLIPYVPDGSGVALSQYRKARIYRRRKVTVRALVRDLILITIGIFSAAFGLKGFLLPNQFIDGGAMGIALLVSGVNGVPLHWMILAVNAPFIFLGYRVAGLSFAVKTGLGILVLALVTATFHFPEITHDKLLTAIFGGFFLGAGIGLAVRGGAVIDGTEVLAIQLGRKLGATIGDVITVLNVIIFSVAAYLLTIDAALYSMITYLAASRTVDFVVEGIEEYLGITIVSSHHEEIRQMILTKLGRGVTMFRGTRGTSELGRSETEIVYTVITRLEMSRLYSEVAKIDPHAFIATTSVKDTRGGLIKKRRLKH